MLHLVSKVADNAFSWKFYPDVWNGILEIRMCSKKNSTVTKSDLFERMEISFEKKHAYLKVWSFLFDKIIEPRKRPIVI